MDWQEVPEEDPDKQDKRIPKSTFVLLAVLVLLGGLALIIILNRK